MTRNRRRGRSRHVIPAFVMAALLAALVGCGTSRLTGAGGTPDVTPRPAGTSFTPGTVGIATPSVVSVPPSLSSVSPSAPCLRLDDGATLSPAEAGIPPMLPLCLKLNEHVTVKLRPPTGQTWDSGTPPQLAGSAVTLSSTLSRDLLELQLSAAHSGHATVTATGVAVHGPGGAAWVITVTVD